jgi:outer membrane protein
MKNISIKNFFVFGLACLLTLSGQLYAQKFGYIDSKFILNKMPEYKAAQGEISSQSQKWQKEIEDMRTEVEKLRKEYLAEEVLLTDDMKKERSDIIAKKDKASKEKQQKIFGFEGLYFLKKQELVKPLQDKVFEAVEKVCKKKKIQIMFDKAGDLVMIYTDTKHDYTDFVLEELGLGDKDDTIDNKRGSKQ